MLEGFHKCNTYSYFRRLDLLDLWFARSFATCDPWNCFLYIHSDQGGVLYTLDRLKYLVLSFTYSFCLWLHADYLLSSHSHTGFTSPSLLIVVSLPLCVQPACWTACGREASLTKKWQSPVSSRPSTMPFCPVKPSLRRSLTRWTTQTPESRQWPPARRTFIPT